MRKRAEPLHVGRLHTAILPSPLSKLTVFIGGVPRVT